MASSLCPQVVVVGNINTDFLLLNLDQLPNSGQQVTCTQVEIKPGGKGRNSAEMIAKLLAPNQVTMIGTTIKDTFGLWRAPLEALEAAGVNTRFVQVQTARPDQSLPGLAFICVDHQGRNKTIFHPGGSGRFSAADVQAADQVFSRAAAERKIGPGVVRVDLEIPDEALFAVLELANQYNLKVFLDPGGRNQAIPAQKLFLHHIFLVKPNLYEIEQLTGTSVTNQASATQAGQKLLDQGVEHVVISAGADGAYWVSEAGTQHFPVPELPTTTTKDETGCGDQMLSAMIAEYVTHQKIAQAISAGVVAGTAQFYKPGVSPLSAQQLRMAIDQTRLHKS